MTVAIALALGPDGPPPEALTEAARSWASQSDVTWEVVLAAQPATLQPYAQALRDGGVDSSRITLVAVEPMADQITALASACEATGAEQLVLMPSLAVGLTHDWMTRLAGYCTDPAIGAAGPVVLTADGRIEHAGVAVTGGLPLFLGYGLDRIPWVPVALDVSAVTGVVATRRETFERLGGLWSELGELALVDYCLRARGAGLRVVTIADSRLRATPRRRSNQRPGRGLAAARGLGVGGRPGSLLQPRLPPGSWRLPGETRPVGEADRTATCGTRQPGRRGTVTNQDLGTSGALLEPLLSKKWSAAQGPEVRVDHPVD